MGPENVTSFLRCEASLRWDVVAVQDGIADIQMSMKGWRQDMMFLGNIPNWTIPLDPMFGKILSKLHAVHHLRVDLGTMDSWDSNGSYLGRWSFHITAAEVALGRAELTRRWYNGTKVVADVFVAEEFVAGMGDGLRDLFEIDTFVWASTPANLSFPAGLEQWLPTLEGGWNALVKTAPVYDPDTALLLASFGWHYSDLIFNLYGIIWLSDLHDIPGLFSSAITLVDSSIFHVPGADGGGGSNGGGGGGGSGGDEGPGGPTPFPWSTLALFVAVSFSVIALLVVRLKRSRTRWYEMR